MNKTQIAEVITKLELDGYVIDDAVGQYADWSTVKDDGTVVLEVGNGVESIQLELEADALRDIGQKMIAWSEIMRRS